MGRAASAVAAAGLASGLRSHGWCFHAGHAWLRRGRFHLCLSRLRFASLNVGQLRFLFGLFLGFLGLLVFVESYMPAVYCGKILVARSGPLAVGHLADFGVAGEALNQLIDGQLHRRVVGEARGEHRVGQVRGMELLVEPEVDGVGAESADGGDIVRRGAEGEAAQEMQNALVGIRNSDRRVSRGFRCWSLLSRRKCLSTWAGSTCAGISAQSNIAEEVLKTAQRPDRVELAKRRERWDITISPEGKLRVDPALWQNAREPGKSRAGKFGIA